jgi:hypothetical protein
MEVKKNEYIRSSTIKDLRSPLGRLLQTAGFFFNPTPPLYSKLGKCSEKFGVHSHSFWAVLNSYCEKPACSNNK